MNLDDYNDLSLEERSNFYQCDSCGQMVDTRVIDDVVFHFDHKERPDFPGRAARLDVAASQGIAHAQEFLAGIYLDREPGSRYPQDDVKAAYWYTRAAEQGRPRAQLLLANLLAAGRGVSLDHAKAVHWYSKAAAAGLHDAQFRLALHLLRGEGVSQNVSEGLGWLRNAADKGHLDSQDYLADCYLVGRGISANPSAAVEWWTKAASHNHGHAIACLGQAYHDGVGVTELRRGCQYLA